MRREGEGTTYPAHFRRVRVQCRQIQVPTPIPRIGADLPAACRQVGIVGWKPISGADCRPVAIMELTSEDAALLIASENVQLKLKRERSGVHEINQLRGQYGEYHHLFPQLKADGERGFQYCRMNIETFTYILGKIEHRLIKNWCNLHQQKILPEERFVITLRYYYYLRIFLRKQCLLSLSKVIKNFH